MDYGGILRRTWRITWDHKYLWWLGLLTALGSGGGGANFNKYRNVGNTPGDFGNGDFFPPGQTPEELLAGLGAATAIIAAVVCVFLVIALVVWVVSVIARGGLISATNGVEDDGQSTFRQGWQAGRGTMWRMLGISVVNGLPGLVGGLISLILLLIVVGGAGLSQAMQDPTALIASAGAALLCIVPLICIGSLASLALSILRPFADRACVMEEETVFASYRRGWEILKENLGDSIVLGIIRIVVSFVAGLVVGLPLLVIGLMIGLVFAASAASGADIVTVPLIIAGACGFVVILLVSLAIGAVTTTFFSSMWTLAYREFTGRQDQPEDRPSPADAPSPAPA